MRLRFSYPTVSRVYKSLADIDRNGLEVYRSGRLELIDGSNGNFFTERTTPRISMITCIVVDECAGSIPIAFIPSGRSEPIAMLISTIVKRLVVIAMVSGYASRNHLRHCTVKNEGFPKCLVSCGF